MQEPKEKGSKPLDEKSRLSPDESHIGSSDAFSETENPLSRDADNISDEKLDELLDED